MEAGIEDEQKERERERKEERMRRERDGAEMREETKAQEGRGGPL